MPDPSPAPTTPSAMPRIGTVIRWTRFMSVLAILSSLVGALVMFWIGTSKTFKAVLLVAGVEEVALEGSRIDLNELATIELLECLDDFLVGLAFLYFAYGIYSLFIQLGRKDPNTPLWLQVNNIGTLKRTLLELLVVLLAVVFVKGLLERLSFRALEWTYLVIPLSILAIAASTRLLHSEDEEPKAKSNEADE